jgi:spermidine synthase
MPVVVAFTAIIVMSGPLRAAAPGARLLYDDESAYNYIQVQEDANGYRYLYLNEGQGIHSQWHPDFYNYRRTWSFFLAAPYFNNPPVSPTSVDSLAIIGLAGGTIARQYSHVYGPIPIDGIEIDPAIIEVGKQFFGLDMLPNLNSYAEDGRWMLNQLDKDYAVIVVDAYRPPYIPWHLTTVEYFEEVRARLQANGVVAVNVGRTDTDRRLVDAMTTTLLQVFPSVHAMDVPLSFNTILVATQNPTDTSNLASNLTSLPVDAHPMLRDVLELGTQSLVALGQPGIVFTDDHAPVETLVDSLVLNFLLAGGAEQLSPGD